MPILELKQEKIMMDFVVGLPKTLSKYVSIWVIVDQLTKLVYFIPVRIDYYTSKGPMIYVKEIVMLFRVLITIVLDGAVNSSLIFWRNFNQSWGLGLTYVQFSIHKLKASQSELSKCQNKCPRYNEPFEIFKRMAYKIYLTYSMSQVYLIFHMFLLIKYHTNRDYTFH